MSTFSPSLPDLQRALALAEKIQTLEQELRSILAGGSTASTEAPRAMVPAVKLGKRGGKRTFSAETKAKMAAAQKARWAKKR